MLKKKSTFYIAIIALAIAACGSISNYMSPDGPVYIGEYAEEHQLFDGTIRVVSYNIKFGKKTDEAIEELKTHKVLRAPDIILLQEMDGDNVEKMARTFDYNYVYYPASVHKRHGKDFGNAVLSRWPITDRRKIILPHKSPFSNQRRTATEARINIAGHEVLAYSVHTETFWLSREKRLEQADSIARSIPDDALYVVVGGDFNTVFAMSIRETEEIFARADMIRASDGVGITAEEGPFGLIDVELDHVFTRGMTVIDRGKSEMTKASDHYPVWLTLRLE
jgi:endonuclease/exonuclease/phosphatase family metal-dependent hydrolase